MKLLMVAVALVGLLGASVSHAEVNEAAALALLKKSKCMTCHSVDKKKDGPSYRDVASKYKDDPTAEQTLLTHITTSPTIEVDGEEEEHRAIKSKDEDAIRNVVRWILSREPKG